MVEPRKRLYFGYRKFDGKKYAPVEAFNNKEEAEEWAKGYRAQGHLVRIVQDPNYRLWRLYARKSKR